MANKGKGKRGRKGKKPQENKNMNQPSYQECDSSDENAGSHKMESSKDTAKPKRVAEKVAPRDEEGAKKPKLEVEWEPIAGPSTSQTDEMIGNSNGKIMCHYKPEDGEAPVNKPYEIIWGSTFLETLVPKIQQGKSILKNPLAEKRETPRMKFAQTTTVYYFERTGTNSTASWEGNVGMEQNHFYSGLFPMGLYEKEKKIRCERKHAEIKYEPTEVPLLPDGQEVDLHTVEVPDELVEPEEFKKGGIRNVPEGCSCKMYCDPQLCECTLSGRQCLIFKEDMPCGCKLEYCKNFHGRKEFIDRYVEKNEEDVTNPASETEKGKGRVTKRKRTRSHKN